MTADSPRPRAPVGLAKAGRALWRSLTGAYEFDLVEMAILAAACRQADDIAALEDAIAVDGVTVVGSAGQPRLNAAITEVRQGRLALGRLLGQLAIPLDAEGRPMTEASRRAQRAANARWNRGTA